MRCQLVDTWPGHGIRQVDKDEVEKIQATMTG